MARTKTCTIDGCNKPHRARGLCIKHYNERHRTPNPTAEYRCPMCGKVFTTERARAKRYRNVFCSVACMGASYADGPTCLIPDDHWARWCGTTSPLFIRNCRACAMTFTTPVETKLKCRSDCGKKPAPARFTAGMCQDMCVLQAPRKRTPPQQGRAQ